MVSLATTDYYIYIYICCSNAVSGNKVQRDRDMPVDGKRGIAAVRNRQRRTTTPCATGAPPPHRVLAGSGRQSHTLACHDVHDPLQALPSLQKTATIGWDPVEDLAQNVAEKQREAVRLGRFQFEFGVCRRPHHVECEIGQSRQLFLGCCWARAVYQDMSSARRA